MSQKILIKNATIVNCDSIQCNQSIVIEDGKIIFIGDEKDVQTSDVKVIDACGKYVIPGGIDPHTHFELEFGGTVSVDDFYHGTKAAVSSLKFS
jgi:dihydropyrimidinase